MITFPRSTTCEGEDVSPPLTWEGVPNGAKSLVLIIDDPDAPDPKAPKMVWVHWVVYNIPADTKSLPREQQILMRMLDGVDPDVIDEIRHAAAHVHDVKEVTEVRARWLGHRLHCGSKRNSSLANHDFSRPCDCGRGQASIASPP